jgi:hypothetical protein
MKFLFGLLLLTSPQEQIIVKIKMLKFHPQKKQQQQKQKIYPT